MKKVLHLSVVSAVVALTALGYWGSVSAQTDPGATTASQDTEVSGVVDAFDGLSLTVDGVTYAITDTTQLEGTPVVGGTVELEFVTGADGSLTATEIEVEDDVEEIEDEDQDELEDEDEDEDEVEDESDDVSDDETEDSSGEGSGFGDD